MYFGYNTNGLAHHRLDDALALLADLGYGGVALTLDHHVLNPFEPDAPARCEALRQRLDALKLRCVVETGARFLLDPRRKHQPTLLSEKPEDRERRIDFLTRAVHVAAHLGADAVSLWSGGTPHPFGSQAGIDAMELLVAGCERLCDTAEAKNVRLAFEPEPGMFVDTLARFGELELRLGRPGFGLTLDVGHVHCQNEGPIPDHVRTWRDKLWNVHAEDMQRGVHDHLMFGEGTIDFPPILAALAEVGYAGGVFVELSRHSHDAVEVARRSLEFLRPKNQEPRSQEPRKLQ